MNVFRAAICLGLLFASLAQAADVRYSLVAYRPGSTTPITSVTEGERFVVAVRVKDLRAGTYPRGVWAAYCNVLWTDANNQPASGAVKVESTSFKPPYDNQKRATISPEGIKEFGAFDGFEPLGNQEREVCRAVLTATPGTFMFAIDVENVSRPAYETLVFAVPGVESQKIRPDQIETRSVTITVTPRPVVVPETPAVQPTPTVTPTVPRRGRIPRILRLFR